MITIIGTGHVFDLTDRIHRLVRMQRPDLVAVELDRTRLQVLEMERRNRGRGIQAPVTIGMLFKPSPIPFRFRIIAYIQKKLAALHNVFPGEEMLSAVESARLNGARIALIDRDINRTISSLNRAMGPWERMKFLLALFAGFAGFGGKGETLGSQIQKIEQDYDSVIMEITRLFPGLKKALIDERDLHMAYALFKLQETYPNILVFVGEAHVVGMERLLSRKGIRVETIHLHSFMTGGSPDGDVHLQKDSVPPDHINSSFVDDSMTQSTHSFDVRMD